MTKIDSLYYLSNQARERVPSGDLGKDEFLKLLVAQLQNQDPLNPMEDRDFIAQMSTFSSLEQLMNMSKSMDALLQSQLVSPVIQYSHMIGKEVTYENEDYVIESEKIIKSKVISVSQKDGWAILELENGDKVYADSILKASDQIKD